MSVTDPLIKELKGCILKFMEYVQDGNKEILDENDHLQEFCSCLERIFTKGLIVKCNALGFPKQTEAWIWMYKITRAQDFCVTYAYKTAVERVRAFPTIHTNIGRLRLLLRSCLVHRCLHVPIQAIATSHLIRHFYDPNYSIIGDEILREITLSVLLQCENIKFNLVLSKASFLDDTWLLPHYETVELIPCTSLGMSVTFINGKAVIVDIKPSSVADEEKIFEIGDILDELNGNPLTTSMQGKLSSIMRSGIGKPIKARIIKARYKNTPQLYPPIIGLLKQLNVDLDVVRRGRNVENSSALDIDAIMIDDNANPETVSRRTNRAGYEVLFIGTVSTGKHGEVKQIERATKILLATKNIGINIEDRDIKRIKKKVFIEIHEIGIRVVDADNGEIILNHSYMEISSCGSTSYLQSYFAYIAGDKHCNLSKQFTCYVFYTPYDETLQFILQSIAQGFQRTHYAV